MKEYSNAFNNADSFAMIFDEAWKKTLNDSEKALTVDQRIQNIIEENKDHPFIKSSPEKAFSVAKFRLRLLQLE